MIFNKEEHKDLWDCIDWVEHLDDQLRVGIILKSDKTGYWYFKPELEVVLEFDNAVAICKKLAELNIKERGQPSERS